MKISKKSLSYRFLAWANNGDVPDNLCNYFWATVGLSVGLAIMGTVIVVAAGICLSPIAYLFSSRMQIQDTYPGLGFDAIILVVVGCMLFSNTLIWKYLMSVKNKYCPKITFTEK